MSRLARPFRILLSFAALGVASLAAAQAGDRQPLPAVPPPPPGMEAFDQALEPQVTILRNEKETREEYRLAGKLYMIKVTPSVGKPYYLIDQQGNGQFVHSEAGGPQLKPPMWLMHSW